MAPKHNLAYFIECRALMGHDYACIGCGFPIHWWCSFGDNVANAEKGHGAHYWCMTCWAKKCVQESSQAGCQESSVSAAASSTIPASVAAVPVAPGSPDKLKCVVIRTGEHSFDRDLSPVPQETVAISFPPRQRKKQKLPSPPNIPSPPPQQTKNRKLPSPHNIPSPPPRQRKNLVAATSNTTAVLSSTNQKSLLARVSQWEDFLKQLNRPLTPSSCGQPASDPRTPVSHGETGPGSTISCNDRDC